MPVEVRPSAADEVHPSGADEDGPGGAGAPGSGPASEPRARGRGAAWVTAGVWVAALAAALAVGAWAARPAGEVVDVLAVASGGETLVLDARAGEKIAGVDGGILSPDASVVVTSRPAGSSTLVSALDAATGIELWRREVPAGLSARLVSMDGDTVVLGPDDGGDGVYAPPPRVRTTLAVSRPGGVRSFRLDGNFEPEALSRDGRSLFVISYLPPDDPQRYQVRRLDLVSGAVGDVFTPDEELQQAMGGTARVQVWAPDGSRLYTLYTLDGPGGPAAFVHVLALDELWAHCVDLPAGVAVADERAASLAISADGGLLYVTDRSSGTLVEIDTAQLAVSRTADLGSAGGRQVASAVTADGALLVGAGRQVEVRSPATLAAVDSWRVPGEVLALQVTAGGREAVAVLGNRRVVAFDLDSGTQVRAFTVPGDGPLESIGGGAKGVAGPRDVFDCAC